MSNKGSDKNVGSIEEDIRILENLKSYLNLLVYEGKDKIIYNDLLWDEKTVDCINAIEHLINNYTRQKTNKWRVKRKSKRINVIEQLECIQKKDKQIELMSELVYERFKPELLLEYGFENEEQLKQYFAGLVEKE